MPVSVTWTCADCFQSLKGVSCPSTDTECYYKNCRLPVEHYITKGLTGEQLELLALKVMKSIEEVGFQVVRLVADNHSTNCKFFASLSGGHIRPVVT